MRKLSTRRQWGGLINVGNALESAVQKGLEQSTTAKQAEAAKEGVDKLSTAIPDAIQGAVSTIEKKLEAQKSAVNQKLREHTDSVMQMVRSELEKVRAAKEETPESTVEPVSPQAGGRRRRGKKISRRGISQMASRRGTRRSTRRRAGSRKARKASRKASRK